MKPVIRKSNIPITLCCVGILLFPYILRNKILGSIALLNAAAYLGLLYGYQHKLIKRPFTSQKTRTASLLFLICIGFGITLLFYVRGNGWSFFRRILLLFVYIFPAAFLNIEIPEKTNIINYSDVWVRWLRYVCSIMCLCKILDLLLGNAIQLGLADFYKSSTMSYLIRDGRFVSYYGHSLNTAYLCLSLLVWTTILDAISSGKRDISYLYDVGISLIGIAISGSKSAIILALLLLVLCNVGMKKIKNMIAILTGFFALYIFGVFDIVIDRIVEGLAIGDLSTSRNTALVRLINNGTITFDMLRGHVIDYEGTSMTAALEYPFLRWAFTAGIVFAVIIYIVYFFIPFIKIIKLKSLDVVFCMIIFMAFVNTNNGISAYNDDLLFYAINVGLIIQRVSMEKTNGQK